MKKLIAVLTAIMLLMSMMASAAFAEPVAEKTFLDTNVGLQSKLALKEELKQIEKKYDGAFSAPSQVYKQDKMLNFKTAAEFDKFISDLKASSTNPAKTFYRPYMASGTKRIAASYGECTWWSMAVLLSAPFGCCKNIGYNFNHSKVGGYERYTSVSNINSWLSGFYGCTWTQSNASYKLGSTKHTNDTVIFTIKGRYTVTGSIAGIPLNYTCNDTWGNICQPIWDVL
jgi:hypothetical protein